MVLDRKRFSDITLYDEVLKKKYSCHVIVLASQSQLFKRIYFDMDAEIASAYTNAKFIIPQRVIRHPNIEKDG